MAPRASIEHEDRCRNSRQTKIICRILALGTNRSRSERPSKVRTRYISPKHSPGRDIIETLLISLHGHSSVSQETVAATVESRPDSYRGTAYNRWPCGRMWERHGQLAVQAASAKLMQAGGYK